MDFTEYQTKVAETAVYPEAGTGSPLALAYVGLGLGEAGEVQGKIKKILRDEPDMRPSDANRIAIMKELGDVLWYVARMCSELSLDFESVAEGNINKLADRRDRGVLKGSGDDR